MEQRVLMTTLFGGETFTYTDARNGAISAKANGNIIAELVAAIQAGDGSLVFGDIEGRITGGIRTGTIIGNGSAPTTGATAQNSSRITIPGLLYTNRGDQINVTGVATNALGVTYAFNHFNVDDQGQPLRQLDTGTNPTTTLQLLIAGSTTAPGTVQTNVVFTLANTSLPNGVPLLGDGGLNADVPINFVGVTNVNVPAAAFNPLDNQLYFDVHYTIPPANGGQPRNVDYLFRYDPANPAVGPVFVSTIATLGGQMDVTGMAFKSTGPGTADLYFSEQANATLAPGNANAGVPQLVRVVAAAGGAFSAAAVVQQFALSQGYGTNQTDLTGITGLVSLPTTIKGATGNFLFGVAGTGANAHVVRISLDSGLGNDPTSGYLFADAINWGSTTDRYQSTPQGARAPFDGQALQGLTFDPTATDPFNSETGAVMSVDSATGDLVYVNMRMRVSAGDVYSVYTALSDIDATLTFQGPSLYTGNVPIAPNVNAGPSNPATATGTALLGFLGQLPSGNTLPGAVKRADGLYFSPLHPILTGALDGSLGVMPSLYSTDPLAAPTNILKAGLTVGRSLEQPLNSTVALSAQLLGQSFSQVTGLGISRDGRIAVMNSNFFGATGSVGDRLAFVDPATGAIILGSTLQITDSATLLPLKNVQGLGYGSINLDGNELLYAIYDRGDGLGPTLGTIDETTGVFTAIGALGLGLNAHVIGMAFKPGVGSIPGTQGLYIVADPNIFDTDATATLYEVNPTTGAVANPPTFDVSGNVTAPNGIGFVRDALGVAISVGGIAFDGAGRLLVQDRSAGRLLDLALTATPDPIDLANDAVAGAVFTSAAGSINSTIGALAFNPTSLQFYAVDNVTGTAPVTPGIGSSSILMKIKTLSTVNSDAESLGKFLFDGVVTGQIYVSGSIDTLYAGQLLTGDASNGGTWFVRGNLLGDSAANYNFFADNVHAEGDIRNVLVLATAGTDGILPDPAPAVPGYSTGLEITAKGKIGNVTANGMIYGLVHAGDQTNIPNISDDNTLRNFGTTGVGYQLNGSATVVGNILSLTSGLPAQTSSIFSKTKQYVGNFSSSFTYTPSTTFLNNGDEGFEFVVQNSSATALGTGGNGLGYKGILKSVGIGFNINPANGGSRMGFSVNGVTNNQSDFISTLPVDFTLGGSYVITVTYDGRTLGVTISDAFLLAPTVLFSTAIDIDIPQLLGSTAAFVGFTGSSGTNGSTQSISAFRFDGGGRVQTETQYWSTSGLPLIGEDLPTVPQAVAFSFADGYVVNTKGFIPFDNRTFAGAQYLGTIRNPVSGQPDVIHLRGQLSGNPPGNGFQNNTVDYFAVALLAGQTIDVTATDWLTGLPGPRLGIYDPAGRQLATDYSNLDPIQTIGRPVRFTADRPGVYRIAVENTGSTTFVNTGNPGVTDYNLTVANVGDLAIGGVVAGGAIILGGSDAFLNNTSNLFQGNHSIFADNGDIGAIVAARNGGGARNNAILAPLTTSTLPFTIQTTNNAAAVFTPDPLALTAPSGDITVSNGNLRVLSGGEIGSSEFSPTAYMPDLNINGKVGLIQSTAGVLSVVFGNAAAGDIQTISASGNISGVFRTNKAIGTIRAGSATFGTFNTEFTVNADNTGSDGTIDLIDVSGNFGANGLGGPSIVTGLGGNVRFMHIGGIMFQDILFGNGLVGTRGEIVHAPGTFQVIDDSGAAINLNPTTIANPLAGVVGTDGTVQPLTIIGALTTRTYGIRGAGGTVLVDVISTTGLGVVVNSGNQNRPGEIGEITTRGAGIPITVVNAIPANNATAVGTPNVVTISSSGGRVDVFSIAGGNTINTISNTTGGDILNITAGDVGVLSSSGNLGSMTSKTGGSIIPIAVFSNAFPFRDQHFGISVANLGSVTSFKSIGNIIASGVIGTITANSDNVDDPNTFEGITGPILINGSAPTTITPPATSGFLVSVTQINIGEGLAPSGSGEMSRAGIYADGRIQRVSGTNADISGDIVSHDSIGTITLSNGSIINSDIMVVDDYAASREFVTNLVLPTPASDIDHPVYNLNSVSLTGNGGIIGTWFVGANLGNFLVSPTGFGIFDSRFTTVGASNINSIIAGGYGIRRVSLGAARVNTLSATGSGAPSDLSNYSPRVRLSETSNFDNAQWFVPNALTDISISILGDGVVNPPDFSGITTGVIEQVTAAGEDRISNILAYDVVSSEFDFARETGIVNIRHDALLMNITTGTIKSVTIGNDATDIDFRAAGQIGPVLIKGDFLKSVDTSGLTTPVSQIAAKGPSGNITSITVNGNFGGDLIAEGVIGTITVGLPGTANSPGTSSFFGTINVGANNLTTTNAVNIFKLNGAITGGTLNFNGNVGTVDIAQDLGGLGHDLVIHGNVGLLTIGSDKNINGSILGSVLTITGNLTTGLVTGAVSSTGGVVVQGNVNNFTVVSDAITAGTDLFAGSLYVGGLLTAVTINGSMSGVIGAGLGILAATITGGSILAGGEITSAFGDIKKVTIANGSMNGSILANNGAITAFTITGPGTVADTAFFSAKSGGAFVVPGAFDGSVQITNTLTSLKVGSVGALSQVTFGALGAYTTVGNMLGALQIGSVGTAASVTFGGNFGGSIASKVALAATINNNMLPGASITTTGNLTSLTVKNDLSGHVIVDRFAAAIKAGSVTNAIITAGMGLTSLTATGAVNNTLLQVGLARGNDGIFGSGDIGDTAHMADATTLAVGSMTNSIFAVGGNIGTFKSTGNMVNSSVSAGIVLQGAAVDDALGDATPLADATELNAARSSPTLFRGNINSGTVGAANVTPTMINSAVTAGVSPGADGDFSGDADNNVNTSLTGGTSKFGSFKAARDVNSRFLANSTGAGATLVNYTLTNDPATSIVPLNPVSGAPTGTAAIGAPLTISTASGTITITITGPAGATVAAYDNPGTTDRLDSLIISSALPAPATVTVTTTSPNTFGLGRVLTTDNTAVGTFNFNGDLLGDNTLGTPDLWIDSDVTTFSVRNLPNDGTWTGSIGGNVGTLKINQVGPGRLRIGGKVTTLNINSSVGNPLINNLPALDTPTAITQLAINPATFGVVATDGTNLLGVDITTGVITPGSTVPIHTALGNQQITVNGLAFNNAGNTLYGVASFNNLLPVDNIGSISAGDTLRGMAVNSQGQIFAIDSQSGTDTLVQIDPVTGTATAVGIIRDAFSNTFSAPGGVNAIMALAFDANDTLFAVINDRDGDGTLATTANGIALARIATADPNNTGFVRVSNPTATGGSFAPTLVTGAVQGDFTGLSINSNGDIFAVRHTGGADELVKFTIAGLGNTATVAMASIGTITVNGGNTQILGMGFDESDNLVALNAGVSGRELIAINTTTPANSARITAANILANPLTGFAIGKTATVDDPTFHAFGYTSDATFGGQLFSSPGLGATLGTIDPVTGLFLQLLPLTQSPSGTPLAGTPVSIALDAADHILVLTDDNIIARYDSTTGALIESSPLGTVIDNINGATLNISRIAFNAAGQLIGLNAGADRLVVIPLPAIGDPHDTLNGVDVLRASGLTELGSANVSDLSGLALFTGPGALNNQFISFSAASGGFVNLLGTSPDTLGGIVANAFGTVNLPASFGGHLVATGNGNVNGIDSIKFTGNGTYSGNISSAGNIGAITSAGANLVLGGAIVSHGDLASFTIKGSVNAAGIIAADGKLGTYNLTGSLDGLILAGRATTITVTGSTLFNSGIVVDNDLTTLTITGQADGIVSVGPLKTLKIGGTLQADGLVFIAGDAGALTITGGTELGSLLLVDGAATTLSVGGTHAGVIGTRRSITTATLAAVNAGVLAIGGNITTLTVSGAVTNAVLSSGTWIGFDGVYNTDDDIIYGGSITTANINGTFTDSFVVAGVLPSQSAEVGDNNIPLSGNAFAGDPAAFNIANVDSAEAGGISPSSILTIKFAKPVVSTFPENGFYSAIVAATSLGKVTASSSLHRIVLTDPIGAPTVVLDNLGVGAAYAGASEIRVVFSEPLDTATLNNLTISVDDGFSPITDLTFSYTTQTAADGSTQGVLHIVSASKFRNAQTLLTPLAINLVGDTNRPAIADRSGLRSSLNDFDQDGTPDTHNPFGTTIQTQTLIL